MHVHAGNPLLRWDDSGLAKKCSLAENGGHCEPSADIYSPLARSGPWCIFMCVCHKDESKCDNGSFLHRVHLNKERLDWKCRRAPSTGRLLWQPQKPEDSQTNNSAAWRLFKTHVRRLHAHTKQVYNQKTLCDGDGLTPLQQSSPPTPTAELFIDTINKE